MPCIIILVGIHLFFNVTVLFSFGLSLSMYPIIPFNLVLLELDSEQFIGQNLVDNSNIPFKRLPSFARITAELGDLGFMVHLSMPFGPISKSNTLFPRPSDVGQGEYSPSS